MHKVDKFIDVLKHETNATERSYWCAMVLFLRFIKDGATLYYHKKTKRFATKIQNSLYDMNGLVQFDSDWVEWNSVDNEIHNEISKIINA